MEKLADIGIKDVKDTIEYYEHSELTHTFFKNIEGRIAMLWRLDLIDLNTKHQLEKLLYDARLRKFK